MEDIQTNEGKGGGCVNCGHPIISNEGPTELCAECREKFIRFPIPLWIRIFGGVIAVAFLFALLKLPKNLSFGLHVEKGKKAILQKNHLTAQKELEAANAIFPDNFEAKANLMIAAFYNSDLKTMSESFTAISEKKIEDNDLFATLQNIVNKANAYFPKDSLTALAEKYGSIDSIPMKELMAYQSKNPDDVFLRSFLADKYFSSKQYAQCDSMLNGILELNSEHMPSLSLKASLKRTMNQLDSSLTYCDKALAINHEYTYMISSRARTLLKQHKDAEAFELATKAYKMNESEYYSLATMALVCHFTNKTKERDAYIKKASGDSSAMGYMQYPLDVINGVEKFRD